MEGTTAASRAEHTARAAAQHAVEELRLSPAAPAGLIVMAVVLYWSARDGATSPLVWVPGSLLIVGLIVVVALAAPGGIPGGRAGAVALASFAAFVCWCFLSILWAGVEADAWSGAAKTLGYFAIYAVFAIRPWSERAAATALGAYSLGITAIGVWSVFSIDNLADPTKSFISGRLAEPISYPNANCALYVGAAVPALVFASRRKMPMGLRAVFLACAGALAQLALLCQSRASLFAIPLVVVAMLLLIPGRLRTLLALALVGAGIWYSGPSLLAVYSAVADGDRISATVVDAQHAMLATALALALAGMAWAALDRRLELPPRAVRIAGSASVVAIAAICLGAGGLFVHHYGNPVTQTQVWWDRFKANDYVSEADTPHLVSGFGGAGRYEIWRVGLRLFEQHPVAGVGVDNFGVQWLEERPNQQDLRYPHSLQIRLLQQTGLVGFLLMALVLGAAFLAGWRAARRQTVAGPCAAGAALLVVVYWAAHGSVDWLWEIPGLSGAAFAALGLAVARSPVEPAWKGTRVVPVGAALCACVAVIALVPLWLSAREIDIALHVSRERPGAAYEHLDRARFFNPLSDQPDVLGAVIAAQRGDVDRQRAFLERALETNRFNWYPYLELGLIEAWAGDRAAGLAWIGKARTLNPRDGTIRFVARRVANGNPPTQAEVDERFVRSADELTGVVQE